MQTTTEGRAESPFISNQTYCQAILSRQDTINTLEHLCTQISETLICLGRPEGNGFHAFARKEMAWVDEEEHSTTTAQCVLALQDLVRITRSIKRRATSPQNLMFETLPDHSPVTKTPEKLQGALDSLLKKQIAQLAANKKALDSGDFGRLNPFTCAHVFSALAPTEHLLSENCWTALFGILWALQRHYPDYDRPTGAAMPYSRPTAFVTSLCIDAIESLIELLMRRWARQKKLIELIDALGRLEDNAAGEHAAIWRRHRQYFLADQINESLLEASRDAALNSMYAAWQTELNKRLEDAFRQDIDFTVQTVCDAFRCAMLAPGNAEMLYKKKAEVVNNTDNLEKEYERVSSAASYIVEGGDGSGAEIDWERIPQGLVDGRYLESHAGKIAPAIPQSDTAKKFVSDYWRDHQSAALESHRICTQLQHYLIDVIDCYLMAAGVDPATGTPNPEAPALDVFLTNLGKSTERIEEQKEILNTSITTAIQWSETIMDHQLALARANHLGELDVAELAHAARIVTRTGWTKDPSVILESVKVVCAVQYADGKWAATQPFFWKHTGLAAYPHSDEVAWALVSIMQTLTMCPGKFSLSQREILAYADDVNRALERFLGWLNANARSYKKPDVFDDGKRGLDACNRVFGWATDRTPEPALVQTWATANVAEFLVQFRSYLQEQINAILCVHFLSYQPSNRQTLNDFHPPDLSDSKYQDRIGIRLWNELKRHRRRTHGETRWIPHANYGEEAVYFSYIVAGPPGSAKSYLARCIAGELGWPLIALSPSDFLSAGEAEVEARAHDVFNALAAGSRLVYFFDEIDELILDRASIQEEASRSVFSFLTPSFLTKLQDLRDAATHKSFMFLIGTNYLDRIDPAAKRAGRIDDEVLVVYPDQRSREAFLADRIRGDIKASGKAKGLQDDVIKKKWEEFRTEKSHPNGGATTTLIEEFAAATPLLSLPRLKKLSEEISKDFVYADSIQNMKLREDWKWLWADDNDVHNSILKRLREGSRPRIRNLIKPEADLGIYWGRPRAVDEWVKMMSLLYPDKDLATPEQDLCLAEARRYIESLKIAKNGNGWELYGLKVLATIESLSPPWYKALENFFQTEKAKLETAHVP